MSSPLRLAELGSLLDVRPQDEVVKEPIESAVNIPFEGLSQRLHELPSAEIAIYVANVGPDANVAQEFLNNGRRNAELTNNFDFAANAKVDQKRLWRPNAFLEEILPNLQKGRALDLGCGSGRESVFLAGNGFEVIAADILPDALEKGKDLARRYLIGTEEPKIEWIKKDLEKDGPPEGPFDLIVSFRYLHRRLLERAYELLNKGGSLVLETFTELHREKHGKPCSDDHVLKIGELPNLAPGLSVQIANEGWRGDSHTGRLWAIRN